MFEIVSKEVLCTVRGSNNIRSPSPECYTTFWMMTIYSDTLHWSGITPIFDPIWTFLPNLTFYRIARGFHRTFTTGAACQQRTLTSLDTWSRPTLGLKSVLMSRPMSPELALFPDFEFRSYLGTSVLLCIESPSITIALDVGIFCGQSFPHNDNRKQSSRQQVHWSDNWYGIRIGNTSIRLWYKHPLSDIITMKKTKPRPKGQFVSKIEVPRDVRNS